MLVADYLEFAINGEIRSLSISDIGGDTPTETQTKNRNTLISYLNLANIAVHTKFALLQKEFLLENVQHNSLHSLPLDFLYVISATFEDGTEIPINRDTVQKVDDNDTALSVMFPAPYKALFKGVDSLGRTDVSLIYTASPVTVKELTDFIDLSTVYTEAILNYMAYKAYASIQGDMQATNNTFYLRYNEDCKNIKQYGLTNSDNLDNNNKFDQRGFV